VLVSSHLMSELQDSAGHVVIVGRGKVIADTSVADLLGSVSGDRVMLRTAAGTQAAAVLERAGATAAVTGPDALMVSGLPAERVVALLSESSVPFAEVTAHRATLEQAYMELTKGAVEFQSGGSSGLAGRAAS
jgi:ABC-2 type transport system ATP-binding protein